MDRNEVREEIARALERVAGRQRIIGIEMALCAEATELRQLAGASEPTDPNVESVRAKLAQRSAVGRAKYGTDTTRSDLDARAWLTHLQEELMDAAVYVERLLREEAPDADQ